MSMSSPITKLRSLPELASQVSLARTPHTNSHSCNNYKGYTEVGLQPHSPLEGVKLVGVNSETSRCKVGGCKVRIVGKTPFTPTSLSPTLGGCKVRLPRGLLFSFLTSYHINVIIINFLSSDYTVFIKPITMSSSSS